MTAARPVRIGVVGCGYWGPNHIRIFSSLGRLGARMTVAAEHSEDRRRHVGDLYPWVRVVPEAEEVLADPQVDAVVIATPVHTHYPFARAALAAGKHVLVEKPFVTEVEQARDLIDLARAQGLVLMAGHTFEYTAAVNRMRDMLAESALGEILYVRSERVNLGLFQKDINVLWDLAPHDVSILLYILRAMPTHVSAIGSAHVTEGVEDVAILTLEFGPALMANILVSWLDPRKVRQMTLVGNRKMLVYDDLSANEKLRVYDRGVDGPKHYDSFGEFQYSYRYGDIVTPMLKESEPLGAECAHFLECIARGAPPRSGGEVGLNVTRVLSAAQRSLRGGHARVPITADEPPGVAGRER
jgi:predicted dehydrogenase